MNTRAETNDILIPMPSYRFSKQQSLYESVVIPAGSTEETHRHLREGHFRRRHEQFAVKYGWEAIREDGMESDDYDHQHHCDYVLLVRRNNKEVDAGCRLIRSDTGVRLPIQEFLLYPERVLLGSIEISRMTDPTENTGDSYAFLRHLLGYLDECGVSDVYVTIRERLLKKYARIGLIGHTHLPGKAMEKTSRDGIKEYFLPVLIDVRRYKESIDWLLSQRCA